MYETVVKAVAYYKEHVIPNGIHTSCNSLGVRSINVCAYTKKTVIDTVAAYWRSLAGTYTEDQAKERATAAYNNVFTICQHFLKALYQERFGKNGVIWRGIPANEQNEVLYMFERIAYFWNKRSGLNVGTPVEAYPGDLISVIDAENPMLPMHLADKNWISKNMIQIMLRNSARVSKV